MSQSPVTVLREALQRIIDTRFGNDGDCGVTRIAEDALYAAELAASLAATQPERSEGMPGGSKCYGMNTICTTCNNDIMRCVLPMEAHRARAALASEAKADVTLPGVFTSAEALFTAIEGGEAKADAAPVVPWKDAQEVYDGMDKLVPSWRKRGNEGAVAVALVVVEGMLSPPPATVSNTTAGEEALTERARQIGNDAWEAANTALVHSEQIGTTSDLTPLSKMMKLDLTDMHTKLVERMDYWMCKALARRAPAVGLSNSVPPPSGSGAAPDELIAGLHEAITIARDRASHAGSTVRMKKWDDLRRDLYAFVEARPAAPDMSVRDAGGGK